MVQQDEQSLLRKKNTCSAAAIISICIYALSGPLIIQVNKTIIKDHGLHAPALVSSMGILFTALSTHLLALMRMITVKSLREDPKAAMIPILLVGMCTACSFLLGNKAYVYLEPGFLQMMKAATPALLMIALIVFRVERISCGVSLCCLFMVGGSVLAVLHSPRINATGVIIQVGSQGCEVFQNVLIQFFLQRLSFTALDAGYYIAPMSTLCCFILSWFLEAEILTKDGGQLLFSEVWWLCASGIVGVAVNYSSFFVIQFISSLMAKLVVVARSAGYVIVLIVACGEHWKPLELVGYAITLVAFAVYSYLKSSESKEKDKSGKVADAETAGEQPDDVAQDQPLMSTRP